MVERIGQIKQATRKKQATLKSKLEGIVTDEDTYEALEAEAAALLTNRQIDILWNVAAGKTSIEVARDMGRKRGVVSSHLSQIFRKLGVKSRAGAIMRGIELEYIDPLYLPSDFDVVSFASLTRREREIYTAFVANPDEENATIAFSLFMQEQTLKNHAINLYYKLGVDGKIGLLHFDLLRRRIFQEVIDAPDNGLWPEQRRIVEFMLEGLPDKAIRDKLGMSNKIYKANKELVVQIIKKTQNDQRIVSL